MSAGQPEPRPLPGFEMINEDGLVLARLPEGFHCPACDGRGYCFKEDERGISTMTECACTRLAKRLKLINEAGLPGKFAQARFETYHPIHPSQKLALKISKDFAKDFGRGMQGLVLMGPPGLGKTHLAIAILKTLVLEKGVPCRFVDFFQLLSDIRFGYSQDMSEQAIINPYVNAPMLVIDELGKGRNTDWEHTMLDQIISSRYNAADRVTVFTTNFTDENESGKLKALDSGRVDTAKEAARKKLEGSLLEKLGDRIYSRLTEMCRFVKIEGDDYRPHKVIRD